MRVKIKNLRPNPYRDMEHYPIDKDKIQSLKDSIEQTEFWDNILARPKPNFVKLIDTFENGDEAVEHNILTGTDRWQYFGIKKNGDLTEPIFEIAYGHHRLQALQELGIEEIDIPIKELDDATMIQIMANENMEQWKMNPSVINETVKVARDFLNAELKKYETWELFNKSIKQLFQSPAEYRNTKSKGVGQTTILKFLGKGWKQWMIQDALDTLKDIEIDQRAVETFESPSVSREFKKAIRSINKKEPKKISKEETIEVAKKVQERIKSNKGKGLGEKSHRTTMETMIRQEVDQTDEFDATLKNITLEIEMITNGTKNLKNKIASFNGRLLEMEVKDLKGIQSLFVVNEFSQLLDAINTMANYFGVEFNNLKNN